MSDDGKVTKIGPQNTLFAVEPAWKDQWGGMPSYNHEDLKPFAELQVNIRNVEDWQAFGELVEQKIDPDGRGSIWWPKMEIRRFANKRFGTVDKVVPRHPVYIISKGRYESRKTVKALDRIGVPFKIVVEPQEYAQYAAVIEPSRILQLDVPNPDKCSIPARNFVWEHARASGATSHWILDDNLLGFHRFHNNLKTPVADGAIFKAAEDWVDRYENVAIAGFQYFMFVVAKSARIPPIYVNSRVYSCILIRNDIPYRWRGRYNEDTDLSIRALKDGWCTALFNAFICDKATTMTMKGGNSDHLYTGVETTFREWERHAKSCTECSSWRPWVCPEARRINESDGRWRMAMALHELHPDIATITRKFGNANDGPGRWQHQVDYSGFAKNKLKLKPGVVIPEGADDRGMTLRVLDEPEEEVAPGGFPASLDAARIATNEAVERIDEGEEFDTRDVRALMKSFLAERLEYEKVVASKPKMEAPSTADWLDDIEEMK